MTLRLGVIGMGTIAREMMHCLARGDAGIDGTGVELVATMVHDRARHAGARYPIVDDVDGLLAARPDLVVEVASQAAFAALAPRVLAAGCTVLAGSVGALADPAVLRSVRESAADGGAQLCIPSGALAGIDALAAARLVGIDAVEYERSAPPSTWAGHPAVPAGVCTSGRRELAWEGSAGDAARIFPKNANVAALIALAGIGFERTRVRIFADPSLSANLHVLRATGPFGELDARIRSARIGDTSSSVIVAGSLARGIACRTARIAI